MSSTDIPPKSNSVPKAAWATDNTDCVMPRPLRTGALRRGRHLLHRRAKRLRFIARRRKLACFALGVHVLLHLGERSYEAVDRVA